MSKPADSTVAMDKVDDDSAAALRALKSILDETPNWLNYENRKYPRDYRPLYQLVMEHPSLAKERIMNSDGTSEVEAYPLSFFLASQAPLQVIKEVHQMNPDAIKTGVYLGLLPMHHSILSLCKFGVVEFLLRQYPQAAKVVILGEFYATGLLVDLLREDQYASEEFALIFQLLYDAHPPECWSKHDDCDVTWGLLLSRLIRLPNLAPFLLLWLAQKKIHHDTCRIDFEVDILPQDAPTLLQNLKIFVSNLGCEKLSFYGGNCRIDGACFAQLFSQVDFPTQLRLEICNFQVSLPVSFQEHCKSWTACQLKHLFLHNLRLSRNDFNGLLKSLKYLSHLEGLRISQGLDARERIPCTSSVIEVLEESPSLYCMSLHGHCINVAELCIALQKPTKAVLLNYWEDSNPYGGLSSPDPEVAYFSALNFCGRVKLAASSATKKFLVECLCYSQTEFSRRHPNLAESLLYGLLREVPVLWSITDDAAGAKNKHNLSGQFDNEGKKKKRKTGD